jgi:hypothetical protein
MPVIAQFEHNGITIERNPLPTPMGPLGSHVVCWVGTAPDKHADVPYNVPFRVANKTDAAKLDTTGDEKGWLFHATSETMKKVSVPQYVIVVEVGADDSETMNNIIGGIDASTGQRTGIAAIELCSEKPTIVAAPGYTHMKDSADELVSMAKKLFACPHLDGTSTNTSAVIAYSGTLGGEGTGYDAAYLVEPQPAIYSKNASANIYVPPSLLSVGCHASMPVHESPGNQGTYAKDVQRTISYNILDKSTEGNLLNKNGISYFAATDLGGISLIGNRSVTGRFINQVCLEQSLCRKLAATGQKAMSKNLSKSFMEQEITKLNVWLASLKANEEIIGAEVVLHPELNSIESYRNGTWYIAIRYASFPPNEHMVYQLNEDAGIIEQFLGEIL